VAASFSKLHCKWAPIYGNAEFFNFVADNTKTINGCWEWQGGFSTHKKPEFKYGIIRRNGKGFLVHRFVWEILYGKTSLNICHHCDNPKCCNPAHLFAGTQKENVNDMTQKGRRQKPHQTARGSRKSKILKEAQVSEIRKLSRAGNSGASLSRKFSVSTSVISWIINNHTWKHVK
jgi:hypothetical protein